MVVQPPSVSISSAVAVDINALCRRAFHDDHIIFHVQFLELRRVVSAACAVDVSLLHCLNDLIVLQFLGADKGRAAEGLSYAVAVIVVVIAHVAEKVIIALSYHHIINIRTVFCT